ncbi:hypothetical protein [Paenibacillus foliorum]|uniref:hypothetical protein n=1 Tax=Paenibacillus foliorum TaxID=2654974 RepID=UPI001C11E388|nr:hypothetical protein [Paenibacillus foliorum]
MKKTTWIIISCLCVGLVAYGVMGFSDSSASAEISKETKGNFVRIEDGAKKLVITADGKETVYTLSATAWVYRNMHKSTLSELQAGDTVDLILNSKEQAAYIKASSPQTAAAQSEGSVPPNSQAVASALPTAAATGVGGDSASVNQAGEGVDGKIAGPQLPTPSIESGANGTAVTGLTQPKGQEGAAAQSKQTPPTQLGAGLIEKLSMEWKSKDLMLRIKLDSSTPGKSTELYVQTKENAVIHLTGASADAFLQMLLKGLPMERQAFEQALKQRISSEFHVKEAKPEWKLDVVEWRRAGNVTSSSDKENGYEKDEYEGSSKDKDKGKDTDKEKNKAVDKDKHKEKDKGKDKDKDKDKD